MKVPAPIPPRSAPRSFLLSAEWQGPPHGSSAPSESRERARLAEREGSAAAMLMADAWQAAAAKAAVVTQLVAAAGVVKVMMMRVTTGLHAVGILPGLARSR